MYTYIPVPTVLLLASSASQLHDKVLLFITLKNQLFFLRPLTHNSFSKTYFMRLLLTTTLTDFLTSVHRFPISPNHLMEQLSCLPLHCTFCPFAMCTVSSSNKQLNSLDDTELKFVVIYLLKIQLNLFTK